MHSHLECSACGATAPKDALARPCTCGSPVLARYDTEAAAARLPARGAPGPASSFLRFAPLLPLDRPERAVSLGEGGAPLVPSRRWGPARGLDALSFQWEGSQPTLSFKARGAAILVARARELGVEKLAAPSAGNAGSALAAYATATGMGCLVAMPSVTPEPIRQEARALGAEVIEVDGHIVDAARALRPRIEAEGWFDAATWSTPYRLEGKKTMAFELHERLGDDLPDWIVFPSGGGIGIVAMAKAFDELEACGRMGDRRPRLFVAQVEGCAPIVRAWEAGAETVEPWESPRATAAYGLAVPVVGGGPLVLDALRRTGGGALAVSEEAMREATAEIAREEGLWSAPEGGAAAVVALRLVREGIVEPGSRGVVFLTAAGLKY